MPKELTTGKFSISNDRNPGVREYKYRLKWQGPVLEYDHRIRSYAKEIDLTKVVKIRIKTNTDPRLNFPRLLRLKTGDFSFRVSPDSCFNIYLDEDEFANFYYWVMVSVIKNSRYELTQEDLTGIPVSSPRRGKLQSRYALKQFDAAHDIFVNAHEAWAQDKSSPPGSPKRLGPRGLDPGIAYAGEEGVMVTEVGERLATGKAGTFLYHATRLCRELRQALIRGQPRRPGLQTRPCVLKVSKTSELGIWNPGADLVIAEARNLKAIGRHPNIMQLLDVKASEGSIALFFEKGLQNLRERTREGPKLAPKEIVAFTRDLFMGMGHMHSRRVYHLDFKPENALFFVSKETPGRRRILKVIDFDLSRSRLIYPGKSVYEAGDGWHMIGTPTYIPPESWHPRLCQQSNALGEWLVSWKGLKPGQEIPFKGIHLEKRDSFALGMTILDSLIGPRYDLACGMTADRVSETPQKCVSRIRFWQDQMKAEASRPALERDNLWPIARTALGMIAMDLAERTSVMRAFFQLFPQTFRRQFGTWDFKDGLPDSPWVSRQA